MAGFNYARAQRRASNLIKRYGGVAQLLRDGVKRPCLAVIVEYSAREKEFVMEGASRVLISRKDPVTRQNLILPPNHELDRLVFAGAIWRLVSGDNGPRPSGDRVFHDFQAVYSAEEDEIS